LTINVDGLLFGRIDQRPAAFVPGSCDLDVFVVAVLDALILPIRVEVESAQRVL
jgi:hypothetical protein